ncbi:hypothetical protein KEM56_003063 [Ascosphaera pollenicola]|nr:hypothetical protein KEM56_003063 [Ascosphaera pollenicola]
MAEDNLPAQEPDYPDYPAHHIYSQTSQKQEPDYDQPLQTITAHSHTHAHSQLQSSLENDAAVAARPFTLGNVKMSTSPSRDPDVDSGSQTGDDMNMEHELSQAHLASGGHGVFEVKEQDRWLPIANVARIMKTALPDNAKIAKEAKECMQECVSEFISFITSEGPPFAIPPFNLRFLVLTSQAASEKCQQEKRKTVNGEDILFAMTSLGFENYSEALKIYLAKYRETQTNRTENQPGASQSQTQPSDMVSPDFQQQVSGDVIDHADPTLMTVTPETNRRKPDGYHYGMPVYKYIGIPETEATVEQILDWPDEFVYEVIFTDVPPNVIEEVFIAIGEPGQELQLPEHTYLEAFDKTLRTVTLSRFVCPTHSAPKGALTFSISEAIRDAGMRGIVLREGPKQYISEQRVRGREPSCCWRLPSLYRYRPSASSRWPGLVLKVQMSVPVERLAEDARFWLIESRGAVKAMLTFNLGDDTMSLASWVLSDDENEVVIDKQMTAEIDEDRQWRLTSTTTEFAFPVENTFGQRPPDADGDNNLVISSDMFLRAVMDYEEMRTG